MNLSEREYFISRIRVGYWLIYHNDQVFTVRTPTIEDEFLANEQHRKNIISFQRDGFISLDEMKEWMITQNLWSEEKDRKIEGIEKDIENMKVAVFENRLHELRREQARMLLRAGEKTLKKYQAERDEYFGNTCEGMADQQRQEDLFVKSCFLNNNPINKEDWDVHQIFMTWAGELLQSTQVRELARTEPWTSVWSLKDNQDLFFNKGPLSVDQKNILVYSMMYDNVRESTECPSDDVIQDDDMLDGWFILQRRKHKEEKVKAEMEDRISNPKISSSDEVFVMAHSKKDAADINLLNSYHGQVIKKQREQTIINKGGEAQDVDFMDQRIKLQNASNQQFKRKFGG